MTNIEQLMQDSEVMRMLKLGNPERSKDFNSVQPPVGLFDIERQLKKPLEVAIYNSSDPDGTIANFDTALMLNNLGLDMETTLRMAEMGFSSSVTGIDTRDKNYWEALKATAQHSHWQDMKGITSSLYRISGNKDFLDLANVYDAKIRKNPALNTYGGVGDLVLDSVQPALSSLKFIATTAMLSWIPGGIANKVWGPAVAKTVAKGGGIAANAVNWFAAGYSQAGDVLYNVMQMDDAEGNKLPWDSPIGGILFHSLAGLMGLIELGSMEMFPWYKHLKSRFTNREFAKHIERGFLSAGKSILWKGTAGTFSEGGEEGLQTGLGIGFENALKALANKDGAEFELASFGDTIKEATKATIDAGKSMFLTSFLTAGFGQSAYSLKLRASAKKNFLSTKDSLPIDSMFVGVPMNVVEQEEEGVAAGPIDPVRVVNVGTHLAPIDHIELRKAARAKRSGAEAMEVIVEDFSPMDASDRNSLLHRAALATEGKILEDSAVGYESQDALDRAAYLLSSSTESIERNNEGIDLTIRDEDGQISQISLRLILEGQEAVDPDLSYVDDPEAPYSLSRLTEDRALEWQERQLIKQSLGDVVAHTGGRISYADLEANIDAIKLVAETLDIPTDRMLKDNLVFALEKASPKGERGYIENITVEGRKHYTIHVSERADATTILHELGHFMRGTATKEQLAQFTDYYGKGTQAVWLEDINKIGDKYHVGTKIFDTFDEAKELVVANEEAFADDFVAYLRTGEAPNEELRNIFKRMKAILTKFVKEFGYTLDPQVRQAFDNLLAPGVHGAQEVSGTYGPIPIGTDGNVLFQIAPRRDFYAYQNANMERTHKKLFYIEGMDPEFAERIENAGDIGRELSKLDGGSGWMDHFYVGEKMRKLGRILDDDGSQFYLKDFMELPATEILKDQEQRIVQQYKDQYNAYPGELGSLGELSKQLSFAVLDRDVTAMKEAWVDFIVEWNELRESQGVGRFPLHLYGESLRSAVTGAENLRIDQLYDETGLPKLYQVSSEYETVVQRFKDTDLWLKAPNGEKTNLTERQWVQVRTPSFKKWFGDWEASENLKWLMSTKPIVTLTGEEFKNHIVDSVAEYFHQTGNRVTREGLGEVTLTRHDIQTSIAHGLGRKKAAAFAAVPDVIRYGREFHRAENYKGRGYDSITIAAPISIGGEEFICEVVINQRQGSNNFYLHEVEVKEKLQFGNQVRNYMDDNHPNRNTRTGASRLIIARLLAEGKFASSKVIDENGEPKVVFNGTRTDPGDVYGPYTNVRPGGGEFGHFFTPSYEVAKGYAFHRLEWDTESNKYFRLYGPVKSNFLNLKNPLYLDKWRYSWASFEVELKKNGIEYVGRPFGWKQSYAIWKFFIEYEADERKDLDLKRLKESILSAGYDGLVINDDSAIPPQYGDNTGRVHAELKKLPVWAGETFIAFESAQIKSATSNDGSFDSGNPNTLFQPAPPLESEAFVEWFGDSKVIDTDGNPKVVFHGSPTTGITEFDRQGANGGERELIYASESETIADEFSYEQLPGKSSLTFTPGAKGGVYPLYMSLQNPLDFRSISMKDYDNIRSAIEKYGTDKNRKLESLDEIITRGSIGHQYFKFVATDLTNHLSEFGYDGLVTEMRRGGPLEYAVVAPTQVKSIKNFGFWDARNPNILFQGAPENGSEQYLQLLRKTHELLKTPEGKFKEFYHGSYTVIQNYKQGKLGFITGADSAIQAFFFTEDEAVAREYAIQAIEAKPLRDRQRRLERQKERLERKAEELLNRRNNDEITEEEYVDSQDTLDHKLEKLSEQLNRFEVMVATGDYLYEMQGSLDPVVNKVLISAAKVMVVEGNISISETLEKAIAEGYEAVYFKDIADSPSGEVSNNLAVFNASNIYSMDQSRQDLELLPEESPWRLYQLGKVESVVTVRDNAPKDIRVYEVSMQPEEMYRLFGEDKPTNLSLESLDVAREINANSTRVSDWQQVYARAMESKGKDGKDLKFSDMRKVNKDGKLMNVPVIALSKGCQRAQVTVERVTNGVLPNETNIEACYGGTCWVNRQFNSKFGAFENMEVRDLLMPSPNNIDNWFKKPSIKEFLTTGPFIREGQMGCSSHAFPILDGYGVSLAETWLKNIKSQGIKQKTIFITAAYAPVTQESYERLLPYKDLFEIHVSISGWFHKNELMTRLAEFKAIRDVGLPVSFRIVTNKDNVADLVMPNQEWLDVQLSRLGIHQDEVLETPYHDDAIKKGQKRSEPTGDYKFICCETGKCMTCGAKCMSKISHQTSEMASYERLDTHEKSPAVSTGLVPLDTSAIPQIQPSGNSYLIPEDAKNQLVLNRVGLSQDESHTKLFQLSDEVKKELLDSRKRDVRNAVENFYWIPEDVLMEYTGEEWADNEIQFREHLRNFPWALEEARRFMNSVNEDGQYPTTEEFVDYIKEKQSMDPEVGDFDWILEDEMWYRRVYEYAKIKSPEELDRQFIRLYTRSNEMLLFLAKRLKGYQDLNQVGKSNRQRNAKSQRITYRWGAFKGVSTVVKGLNRDSTDTEFEKARNIIKENPRPYRRALMTMEQAEARVLQFRGIADADLSRDAYYESLGESMQDALNEPLLLNEMTDRQAAEYLRSTDDKRERFEAREKLATHSGVLAMEQEANAELARLADEHEKTIRYLEHEIERGKREIEETIAKLQGKLKDKSEKASMVPDLKRALDDRRARVVELNSQLSETKKSNKQLLVDSNAMKERENARKLKEKIEDLSEQVKRSARFTTETMDASFERLFTWVRQRIGLAYGSDEQYVPAPWEQSLDLLAQYIPDDVRTNLNLKVSLDKWSVKTMEDLIVGMRMLARDARVQQNQRMLDQGTRRDAMQVAYYRQVIGKDPEITGQNSISYDLADAISDEPGKASDKGFSVEIKTANAWFMKIQRLARKLDGNKEGILYEFLVRRSHYNQQQEFRHADARIAKEYEKRKELGISDESLQQELYVYNPVVSDLSGKNDSITLTRDQVIGVYIYAKHEVSRDKLLDKVVGNRMTEMQIVEAINKLSDKEREYADWLIQELGGDEPWLRLAETYYRVYNRRLGRRPDYFTFEAENKNTEGNTDILVGPKGDPVRYVDKGMTKQVNVWARYALRLDATNIFEKNVRRQEHFIAWAQWVRDLNFMLSSKGALGRIIADRYGDPYRKSIQTYVNEVGSPNIIMSDMDHILNKLVSTASGATLAYSTLSFFRQTGSATAIFRGDVTMYGFMKATSQLMNPAHHEEVIQFIDRMAPDIKHRSFDLDKTRLAGTKFQTRAGRVAQRSLVFGMQHMGWMDKSIAYALWLAAYESFLKKNEVAYFKKFGEEGPGLLSKEAAFRASQFIAETQSTTNPTDLNEIQRSRNPWMRLFFMFSNDLMQHWNQIWKDIPYYWAQKDHRKLIGTMVALSLNLGLQLAISGALLPDDDGDDEQERRRILLALLSEISRDSIPLIGSAVSGGIEGWTGTGIVTPAPIGSLINAMTTGDDDKILSRLWNLILEGAKVSGVPVVQGRKVVKSVKERNPFYVLNTDWGRFGERWFGE